jgi:hypothetical protein
MVVKKKRNIYQEDTTLEIPIDSGGRSLAESITTPNMGWIQIADKMLGEKPIETQIDEITTPETDTFKPTWAALADEKLKSLPPQTPEELATKVQENLPEKKPVDQQEFLDRVKNRSGIRQAEELYNFIKPTAKIAATPIQQYLPSEEEVKQKAKETADLIKQKKKEVQDVTNKATEYAMQLPNVPENIRRGIVQNIRSSPGVAGKAAQYLGAYSQVQKDEGIKQLNEIDPTGKLARSVYGKERLKTIEGTSETLTNWGEEKAKKNQLYMETRKDLQPTGIDVVSRFSHGLGSGAGRIAEASAIGLITRNPELGGAVFGLQAAGDTYVNAKQQGLDTETAVKYATLDGVLEAGLEGISISKILAPGAGRSLKAFLVPALTEMSTEGAQEFKGNLIRKYGLKMDQNELDNVFMSMSLGFVLGGGTALAIPENVKQSLDKQGVPDAAQQEMLQFVGKNIDKLKQKQWTDKEIK